MPKITDHKTRDDLLALQFNIKLVAEGLSAEARRDRRSLAHEARTESTERRNQIEMRRRPSYASIEARQPFEPDARLIRADDRLGIIQEPAEPEPRPTYEEMRAKAMDYPDTPAEVREYARRKREQRRTATRVRKGADRNGKKK
jgi:hypothetical protein